MYNQHIIDWLSWQLHPGASLTQMMGNFPLAYSMAMKLAKTYQPTLTF